MTTKLTDQEIVNELNLSYQQIATLLGVTRQAIRNAIVKDSDYLTLDRLLKIYAGLPQGRQHEKLQTIINNALPWNSIETVAKSTETSAVLSRKWISAWLFSPGLNVIQPTLQTIGKYVRGTAGLSVAIILPKASDVEQQQIKLNFKANLDQGPTANIRLAIADMAQTAIFPATIIFNLPQHNDYAVEAYMISGAELIRIPRNQTECMVNYGLYNIDPWRKNDIWGLTPQFISGHTEVLLSPLPEAASVEDEEEDFALEYMDKRNAYGSLQVAVNKTKTGWWITLDSDDLHGTVDKITLFSSFQNQTIDILKTSLTELPIRKPWPLSAIFPYELLKNNQSGIKLEVV